MKKLLLIAFTLLQVCKGLFIQAQQINIHRYNIEDGLVNNDIINIYQDSRGFIWFCTRGGLSRYDGSRFTNYTTNNGLTNDMINDIVEIAPQEFIVAQNLDGPRLLKNDRIVSLTQHSRLILNNFYRVNATRLLATTDSHGMAEWRNGNFRLVDTAHAKSIGKITVLNDSVWLLLEQEFYIQLATPLLQPLSPITYCGATTSFIDSRHRTWVGTSHGLRLLDPDITQGEPIRFLPLPSSFNLPMLREAHISDFMEDSRGNYWIGTLNGLVMVDKTGRSSLYTPQDGLPESSINCIKEDRQNNIWIGTTQGLAKLSLNNDLKVVALNQGPSRNTTVVILPLTDDRVRLFNKTGSIDLDLQTHKLINASPAESPGSLIHKLDKEELLIANGKKAKVYRSREGHTETINWPDKYFDFAVKIGQDNFLTSNGNKLYTVSNGNYEEKLIVGGKSAVYCLTIDKNNFIWAGTQIDGLFKINVNDRDNTPVLKIIDSFSNRLPDQHIRALFSDRENEIWIGTRYKGVVRLLELPNGQYEIQNYGTRQGLSSDFVLTINRDKKGNIWVGTMQGLDKLIPLENRYRVFNFGKTNKIFSSIFDIIFLENNYLLAASYHSLLHAADMQQDTLPPPPVYITKASAGSADSSFTTFEAPRLSNNKAQIYFEFSAPQFINEDFTEYSYRLLGNADTSWSRSGNSHSVYFASLRPGSYTFEVRALGFNGRWGEPAVYGFIVNTPFWQKAWFIAIMITSVGLLIYALYRYRIQQLIRLQKVRNRIATDLHDEIGSNLTNISILSSLSKKNLSEPQKAGEFLQRISEEVASSSQALDDIIWSVNSSHDTLEETVARMRRYAAELFDAANISYELHLDPAFEGKKLVMEQRRDIYLLYKEAVNNISKHAAAKLVSIQIVIEHNQLILCIKDDGKGFETNTVSNRHGLKGMKERVKKWKGTITIESDVDKGTSIQIRLPVSN